MAETLVTCIGESNPVKGTLSGFSNVDFGRKATSEIEFLTVYLCILAVPREWCKTKDAET